jgi:ABC-2 type transport system ATP-binding protein
VSVAALETVGLGKRYLRRWALEDCTLRIPRGHVVGLVGPNGAGKSTLLNLAAGLLAPTAGSIVVLGEEPARDAAQRAQLSLTIALAKRPELLLLDEPVSSLDPLARREFLGLLMSTVAGNDVSIVLSSHLVNDIERVCDYLIVLVDSASGWPERSTSCWRATIDSSALARRTTSRRRTRR